jgi:hypothetical protein
MMPLKSETVLWSAPRHGTGTPQPTFSASVGDESSKPLEIHSVPLTSPLPVGTLARSSKVMSVANALFIHSSVSNSSPLHSLDTMAPSPLFLGNLLYIVASRCRT